MHLSLLDSDSSSLHSSSGSLGFLLLGGSRSRGVSSIESDFLSLFLCLGLDSLGHLLVCDLCSPT